MISFSKNKMKNFNRSSLGKNTQFEKSDAKLNGDYVDDESPGTSLLNQAVKSGVSYDFMKKAYAVNPWIRATVDKIIARVNQVDIHAKPIDFGKNAPKAATKQQMKKIEKVQKLFIKPNDQLETFSSIKTKYLKDILIYDNAGVEIVKKSSDQFELYSNASGYQLYPNVNEEGKFTSENKAYVQIQKRKQVASWSKYEMMYFCKNKIAGKMRGFSPIESIALQISADLFADKYNIDFFSNNARPNIAILFENLGFGRGQAAIRRAKQWYLEEHQGKPHLPLFMGAEKGAVKLQQMQLSNKDMEFEVYSTMLLSKIMSVYGMQPFILGVVNSTTGKLNSQEQVNQFKIDAVLPYLKMTVENFNLVLIWGEQNYNYDDIYLSHDDLDLRDMKSTADMYEVYLKNGVITINQVRQELKMSPVPWGDIPYIPVNIAPLGGAAPNRMEQNPAAANPSSKKYKDLATEDLTKKYAGLKYVNDSDIIKALTDILKIRDRKLNKKYFFQNDIEEIDVEPLGALGSKVDW